MPGEPIGLTVDQDRTVAALNVLSSRDHGVDDGKRIIAVDRLGVHVLGVDAGADAGQPLVRHGLADRLAAHAVEVVDDEEDDGQPASVLGIHERLQLRHGGEVEGFPDRAGPRGSVADAGDHQARLRLKPVIEGGPSGQRSRAADDGVVRIDPERREERVHAAAQTLG